MKLKTSGRSVHRVLQSLSPAELSSLLFSTEECHAQEIAPGAVTRHCSAFWLNSCRECRNLVVPIVQRQASRLCEEIEKMPQAKLCDENSLPPAHDLHIMDEQCISCWELWDQAEEYMKKIFEQIGEEEREQLKNLGK